MFNKNSFLLISALLHLLVMYVVTQSVTFPSTSASPQKKPDMIQARLIFDLALPPAEIPFEEVKQKPLKLIEPEEETPVIETPLDTEIEPITESEKRTIPLSIPPSLPLSIPAPPQALPPEREEEVQEEPEDPEDPQQNDAIIVTKKTIASSSNSNFASSSEFQAPVTNMARRHLSRFQQQQHNKMAEQASRYYQQHKNSPVIDNEVENPFMTEDEKLMSSLKIRANCSSASKKTTTVILGFLGGQFDCSKPPPINSFIQDRINKKSPLPGQSWQEDKKRPQSVVIKQQPYTNPYK